MPTLKDLNCSIEVADNRHTLQEFGTTYSDGCVETFVAVPSKPESFSIHLTSDRFIAPGISMYVFVDGVYQCNRNRQDLKLRKGSDSRSVVDFTVRQKEEKQRDGSMIAREWKFDKLDTTSADNSSNPCSPNILENLGCIEVLVLRCAGPRSAKTTSAMNLDGAGDFQIHPFGLDGQPQTQNQSVYDDRGPFLSQNKYPQTPPAPPTYRTPFAESVHSHDTKPQYNLSPFAGPHDQRSHSRTSGPFSPGASIPSEGFQYGSGPIPKGPMLGSERSFYHTRPHSAVVANAPGSDPAWLNEMLTKAAKRGVEEYRRDGIGSKPEKRSAVDLETASQPPGAWPQSPYTQPVQIPNSVRIIPEEDAGTVWSQPTGGWNPGNSNTKSKVQVKWDREPEWDSQSHSGSWGAHEETASDTWDTDETWGSKKSTRPTESQWDRSVAASARSKSEQRNTSPDTSRTRWPHQSEKDRPRKSRSKSRPRESKSSDKFKDHGEWLPVEAPFDSTASSEASDTTARPSRSRSHGHRSKDASESHRKSHRARSKHRREGRSSKHLRGGADSRDPSTHARSVSIVSNAMPGVMNAPLGTPGLAYIPQQPPQSVKLVEPSADPWVPPAPFSTYGDNSAWGADNTGGWEDANAAGDTKDDWAYPQHDQDGWEVINQPGDDNPKKKDFQGWTGGHKKTGELKKADNGWTAHKDSWDAEANPTEPNAVKWDTSNDKGWSPCPNEPKPKPPQAKSASKRHTTKSLSKYRASRPPPSPSDPRPHWKFPPPPTSTPLPTTTLLPPEPRLKVPSSAASSKGIDHHVRAGPGSSYGHMIGRPDYLDTLDKPYAVFRFKYRSREVLKSLFGDEVRDAKGELVERVRTPAAKVKREREKLGEMSKEELVERMVRLRLETEGRGRRRGKSKSTESVARGLTERWVEGQSLGE